MHRGHQGFAARALAVVMLLSLGLAAHAHDGPHEDAATVIDGRRHHDPALKDARAELLRRAEAELAGGDAQAASETFERAAMMLHAADTEMGLVRSYLQAGQYARALAFCAHTAGVHRESPAAVAVYAWLLRAGGQGVFAQRTLEQALQRAPQDAVVRETQRAFAAPLPVASAPLLQTPHRMAPQPVMLGGQAAPPPSARVVGGAVLAGEGALALVPLASLRDAAPDGLWLRNGLGQTTRARREPDAALEAQGVALLRLALPLDAGPAPALAPREPFAGSPGFAFQYAAQPDAQAAWPWLSQGFFAGLPAQGRRRLGIDLPAGPDGGPVFDSQGRLAGMVLAGSDGGMFLFPTTRWPVADGSASTPPAPVAQKTAAAEQVYEHALHVALQLVALPMR